MNVTKVIGLAMVLGASSCHSGTPTSVGRCLDDKVLVRAFPADSFTTIDPCTIVERVQAEVGQAIRSGALEVQALSGWDSVLIVPLTEVSEEGVIGTATWQVQVFLRDNPFDLEAVIERESDTIEVGRVHKPL